MNRKPEEDEDIAKSPTAAARRRSGLSRTAVAAALDLPLHYYDDIERSDDEINTNLSLGQLRDLCRLLKVNYAEIVPGVTLGIEAQTLEELRQLVLKRQTEDPTTLEAVGYDVSEFLKDSARALEWNIDCLKAVSSYVGETWYAFLPSG